MLRSAMFNTIGKEIEDKKVLDIFAGSGSIGLEAISRGASFCTFIDSGRNIIKKLKSNAQMLECQDQCQIINGRVPGILTTLDEKSYDYIFVDPPFDALMRGEFLLLENDLLPYLSGDGMVILRHPENVPFVPDQGLYEIVKEKKYGISLLFFKKAKKPS